MGSEMQIVGREKEKTMLHQCLEDSSNFNARILLLSGEAGMGKSTLVDYLKYNASKRGMVIAIGESAQQDVSIPYRPFQKALSNITDDEIFKTEEFSSFDEIFLISKVGLLISHVSASEDKGMDEDILGSMLTAVQDFVKDSFGDGASETQKGGLGKLEYLNTKIFIEHGDLAYLAVVSSGEEHPDMKRKIKKCLVDIESKYFDVLIDWDGDIDSMSGSVNLIETLVKSKFRVKRSLENINLETERLKVQKKISDLITEKAGEAGILVILEDVHWADESSILAIPYLARNIKNSRVVLCITFRPDDLSASNERYSTVLDALSVESDGVIRISLEPIDEADSNSIICNLLGGKQPPDELSKNLKSETDGTPFFVIEAVRALISEGTLYLDRGVWVLKHGPKSSIPHSVVDLVSRRLETLDTDSLRFIEYGAVLGRRFSQSLLESGFRMPPSQINEVINHLIDLNIFVKPEESELMFQHSKTQEVIYAGMSERWKRVLHKNAGQTIENMNKDNLDDTLFNLAYHFSRTLEYEKGIDYCISAGYKARNNLAPRESAQFIERAVELIDTYEKEDDRYLELNEVLGELYELDGNYPKALSIFDKVLKFSDEKAYSSNILMLKGRVLQSQSNYDEAIDSYQKGILLAEEVGSSLLKAKINGYMGKIYLRKGEYDKALDLQKNYLNESKVAGDKKEIGQAYMNLGGVYYHLSNYEFAINNWKNALTYFQDANHLQGIGFVNDNLGVGYLWMGKYDEAFHHYQNSELIFNKIGDVKGMSMVLLNLGVLFDRMGNHNKSLEYYHKSLQLKKKIGDMTGSANIYNNIGGVNYDIGNYDTALENYHLNLKLMETSGDTWGKAQSLNNIAEAEIELKDLESAKKHCALSMTLAEQHDFKEILSSALRLKSLISAEENNMKLADEYLMKSLEIALGTEDPQRIGMTFFSRARICVKRGEIEKALDSFAKALETFEKANMGSYSRKTRLEMQALIDPN